jgi:hypothetical protein
MKTKPRIYLVHAAAVSIPPVVASFHTNWPEAQVVNLLEDALMTDLAADGKLTDAMTARFVHIGEYCVKAGADAILFCCSAFGPAIEECRRQVAIPVLKPNEAMYEELVAKNGTVSLLATFQPSIPSMLTEIAAAAKAADKGRDDGARQLDAPDAAVVVVAHIEVAAAVRRQARGAVELRARADAVGVPATACSCKCGDRAAG